MMFERFRRLRIGSAEDGIALPVVIGLGMVLMLLVAVGTSVSVSGMVRAQNNDDWTAAMSAAYAGVADYEGRVTNDSSYAQYGNPDAPFTIASGSAATVTMPPTTNPALTITQGGAWASVPRVDSDGNAMPSGATFRYEVDNSKLASTGVVRLRSTGRVGNQTRSVIATIKQAGFTNYIYFTDYEMIDPNVKSGCTQDYAWRSARSGSCLINFIPGDTLDGPVHSNDTLNICGGTFKSSVTSSDPGLHNGVRYTQNNCSTTQTPSFGVSGDPSYSSTIAMPPPAQQINQTRTDIPATVPSPGCLYTGPTSIVFNSNGTMTVRSPWTKSTQITGSPASGPVQTPSFCGTPGDPKKTAAQNANTLGGANGQTLSIGESTQLYNNLIYVQSVPASTSDPNYSPTSNYCPSDIACATKTTGSGKYKTTTTYCVGADGSSAGNGIGYPISGEAAPRSDSYSCTNGDVFVQGTLHGALTINADHYVYVTGDLTYQDPAHDILGLVGAGSVYVWNPVDRYGNNLVDWNTDATCARAIDAAILSNLHSFAVQNYDKGSNDGNLCVTGSIAQEYRGPVGTGGGWSMTGFTKKYSYDTRLLYTPPPKFPTPKTTSYNVATQVEVASAFNADGSPR